MSKKISLGNVYFIVILLSLLITLGTITYLRLTTTEGIIFNDNLKVEFRSEVYVSNFIKNIDGKLISDYKVDTNEVGKKDIAITFKNMYGFIVSKNLTIEVIDVTTPTVIVSSPYQVVKGSDIKLEEEIFCADDYDDYIDCNINGEYDLNTLGKYNLEIVATDKSGNITNKKFILDVIEKSVNSNNNSSIRYTDFNSIYNKYKNDKTRIGLDISKWQGNVDYAKLKKQGVEFVMLKLGGQTEIGGEFIIDPKFYDNIEEAINNDIDVGVYFYSYAKSKEEAIKQADFIVSKLDGYNINMPIVFDWENWNNYTKFHISFHTLNNIASSFINRVEELGYKGVLYSSKYYLENIWYSNNYTNWLAYYNSEFNGYKDYYMWQMCSNGKIDGINGYVDIDIMYVG